MFAILIFRCGHRAGAMPECVAATEALELLFAGQVAPLAGRHLADGYAADADTANADDLQPDRFAELGDDPRLRVLHGEAQAVFVLPAGLDRRQLLALVCEAVL